MIPARKMIAGTCGNPKEQANGTPVRPRGNREHRRWHRASGGSARNLWFYYSTNGSGTWQYVSLA